MSQTTHLGAIAALFIFPSLTLGSLPNGECSVANMTCKLEDDNVIGILNGVLSLEECQEECEDDSNDCRVYSYYGPEGFPFADTCLLYSNCTTLEPVDDCFTEELGCSRFCHAPIEGLLGENLIDFIPELSEAACEAECEIREECHFFTYHWSNSSTFPNTCFLLTEIQEPINVCPENTCVSGGDNCEYSMCGFVGDGILHPNGIIVNETKDVSMLMLGPACGSKSAIAVAIGGGGQQNDDGAGCGSGYVEFTEFNVSAPLIKFEAIVGSANLLSQVNEFSPGNYTLLEALPGGKGSGTNGAPGYSGGGGDNKDGQGTGAGDGGSNGSDGKDGCCYNGGKGSGFDITTIPLKNLALR